MEDLTQTFSIAFLPFAVAHATGGLASGFEFMSNVIDLNACTILTMMVEASL